MSQSTTIAAGTIKRLHVNNHDIRHNAKTGDNRPTLRCKTSKDNIAANQIDIKDGQGNVILTLGYSAKPLSCGARVWIETHAEVEILNAEGA